jgi:cytidylate kinase
MGADQIPVITVDGPGGSGKGTLSQLLAQKLGYRLLDSGAIYRLLALAADWYGVALDNEGGLVRLAANLDVRFDTRPQNSRRVWLESRDVTQVIRTEACGHAASRIAQIKEVREALIRRQRTFHTAPGLVADGRDMGTVVFPQAPLKIFLTASLEERAKRRYKQLKEKGISASLDILLNELARRDERDEKRAVAPLKPAKDAIIIDSTGLSIQEVLNRALELAR